MAQSASDNYLSITFTWQTMTKSSEIDVVINNGDDDDDKQCKLCLLILGSVQPTVCYCVDLCIGYSVHGILYNYACVM